MKIIRVALMTMNTKAIFLTVLLNVAAPAHSLGHLRPVNGQTQSTVIGETQSNNGGAAHFHQDEAQGELIPKVWAGYVPAEECKAAVDARKSHGHKLFAALLLCMMVTINVAFAMTTCSNDTLVKNTWGALGAVMVVIIAGSMYSAAAHLFDDLTAGMKHWKITLHIIWALLLFFVAVYGSYKLKDNKTDLSAFNAVFFWVVLLAKGGALSETQSEIGQSLTDVFIITFGGLIFFGLIVVVSHHMKPEAGWYDDVETSLAGGAFAGGFVTMVDMLIRGHDHEEKAGDNPWANQEHAMMTNGFAFATVIAAVMLTPILTRMQKDTKNYWYGRFLNFLGAFIGILPYFTVSFGLGAIISHKLGVHPSSMMARLTQTMTGTVMGAMMILICAFTPFLQRTTEDVQSLRDLMLGFGGYIAGAGWADLISQSMNEAMGGNGWSEETVARRAMFLVIALNMLFIPVFVKFLKPTIDKKTA